jgi:prophage tail gpP-like protein
VIEKIALLKTDEHTVLPLEVEAGESPADALNRVQISVRARVHTRCKPAIGRLRFVLGANGTEYAIYLKPAPKVAPKAKPAKAKPAKAPKAKRVAKRKAKK